MTLRLLLGGASKLTRRDKLVALNDAERIACRAHRQLIECELGDTDRLIELQRAWWSAELEVERCAAALKEHDAIQLKRPRLEVVR